MKRSGARLSLLGFLILFHLLPCPAFGHGAIDEQIAEVTSRIALAPEAAELYLKRAELYRVHRSWDEALADYGRASRLAPQIHVVELARAQMLHEAGRYAAALVSIDGYLAAEDDSYDGRVLRGRILAELQRHEEAAREIDRALAAGDPEFMPDPDVFMLRARAFAEAGRMGVAIRGLDEGIARLGNLVSLQLLAIEIERRAGRFSATLDRVEGFMSGTRRKEAWHLMRGEILQQAGRHGEARMAFESALEAIASLPARQRSPRTRALEARVRAALDEINSD